MSRKSTNAPSRAGHVAMKGSQATTGAATMRLTVSVFGRFTRAPPELREGLEYQFADGLQGVEDALSRHRHCLEIWRVFHPFACRDLLHEVLAGVVGVGGDPLAGNVAHLEA